MTQDEIIAMFEPMWLWKRTVTLPSGERPYIESVLIFRASAAKNFPPNIIEARPGYLHFVAANGNDVVLEKV